MNILLSRILKYLNGTLFLDDAYRFCVFFILHYQDFDSYTIEDIAGELQTTPESILNFLKYLGFDNYMFLHMLNVLKFLMIMKLS